MSDSDGFHPWIDLIRDIRMPNPQLLSYTSYKKSTTGQESYPSQTRAYSKKKKIASQSRAFSFNQSFTGSGTVTVLDIQIWFPRYSQKWEYPGRSSHSILQLMLDILATEKVGKKRRKVRSGCLKDGPWSSVTRGWGVYSRGQAKPMIVDSKPVSIGSILLQTGGRWFYSKRIGIRRQ